MTALIIEGMRGLGDNIYQRPFVRAAAKRHDVYLETPWPELYDDLPVKFVRTFTPLRTQSKNIDRQRNERWTRPPQTAGRVKVGYGSHTFRQNQSVIEAMESILPLHGEPFVMDLPPLRILDGAPLAIVRPVTVRKEWRNESRNPLPEYIAEIAAELMATHTVVSIADLDDGAEWIIGDEPPAHYRYHSGEFTIKQLLQLVKSASLIVGGVGWIVPAAIAARVPAYIVLGGHGGHNAPPRITDSRMDLSRIAFEAPDCYCQCVDMMHRCNKAISGLMDKFRAWHDEQNISGMARLGAGLAP